MTRNERDPGRVSVGVGGEEVIKQLKRQKNRK